MVMRAGSAMLIARIAGWCAEASRAHRWMTAAHRSENFASLDSLP